MLFRIALLVSDRERFRCALSGREATGVEVLFLDPGDPVKSLAVEPCDIIVIEEDAIPGKFEDSLKVILSFPEAPYVILLTDSATEEKRARLRALGCEAVMSTRLAATLLFDTVDALVNQRRGRRIETGQQRRTVDEPRLDDFVSRSPAMQAFMQVVRRVTRTNSSLLILGETGVGKERLALAIHSASKGRHSPFIAVNCAALPDGLLESELLGHEAGAFTGAAHTRRGAFELAHEGTIFLDEIGELPLSLQGKLLRVLQERRFQRIGGEREIAVDVRIIAATNRPLADDVAQGRFRRDLFYRLGVISLLIPPLRERRDDIPDLVKNYVSQLGQSIAVDVRDVSDNALSALMSYDWPGNVRELINVIERAMLLCEGQQITLADLPDDIATGRPELIVQTEGCNLAGPMLRFPHEWFEKPWREARREALSWIEEAYLRRLYARAQGRTGVASELAEITPRALQLSMKRLGLSRQDLV